MTAIWDNNAAALTWRVVIPLLISALSLYIIVMNCEKIDTKDNCSDVVTKAVTEIILKTWLL